MKPRRSARKTPSVTDARSMRATSATPPVKLPEKKLRFSRRTVALSMVLVALGVAGVFGPWKFAPVAGAILGGVGMVLFFSAGYYWTCDNDSCSGT